MKHIEFDRISIRIPNQPTDVSEQQYGEWINFQFGLIKKIKRNNPLREMLLSDCKIIYKKRIVKNGR